ncbi:MAG: stage IV sporulation protein A [Firmicutes bacterium]|nr:stage IV sporulation protein A [Bacillota bacterium]
MNTYNAYDIYNDIKTRTNGNIYIGIVGPVRTGKSTFIRRFTDLMVLPFINDEHQAERIRDELPQSGTGKTIMTTEPKFVPAEAVTLNLSDDSSCNVRLIDCVGYMVDGALGGMEDDRPRMISTPWDQNPMPFDKAAEIGTRKVITEHSTIGIVITTDGTIGDIPREDYIESEQRVISELKAVQKPFVIVLNSTQPFSDETLNLASEMEIEYNAPVITADCFNMDEYTIRDIIVSTLFQFPASQINIHLPGFIDGLDPSHRIKQHLINLVQEWSQNITTLRDIRNAAQGLIDGEITDNASVLETNPGTGEVTIELSCVNGLFYQVLGEIMDCEVKNDKHFFELIKDFSAAKKSHEKLKEALDNVENTGYGIVRPKLSEMWLEEPELYHQGNRFGVKLKAHAPSLHIISTEITTEISPIVGSEEQSRDLIQRLNDEFRENPDEIWSTNIFGRTLYEMVTDQINSKLNNVPEELQFKVKRSLQKISDEGKDYFICIII